MSWFLTGLEEYTIYIIYVLFYTVGVSPYSLPLEIQTAEDGTCEIVSRTSAENRKIGGVKVVRFENEEEGEAEIRRSGVSVE